jgi:hypothetical protein
MKMRSIADALNSYLNYSLEYVESAQHNDHDYLKT